MSVVSSDQREKTVSVAISQKSSNFHSSQSSSEEEEQSLQIREKFIFPFYSEMSRVAHIPQLFYLLYVIIKCLQIIGSCLWLSNCRIWGTTLADSFRYLFYLTDLGVTRSSLSSCLGQYIVAFAFSVLIIAILSIIYFQYRSKHSFSKWHLYLARAVLTLITPIFIPIDGALLGKALEELYTSQTGISIAFTILMIPTAVIVAVIFFYSNSFQCVSPVLCRGFNTEWDPLYNPLYLFIPAGICLIAHLIDHFAFWTTPFCVAASFIPVCMFFHRIYFLPYLHFYVNALSASGIVTSTVCVIFAFINCFTKMTAATVLIIIACIVVAAAIASYFVLDKRKSKIINRLSLSSVGEEGTVTEAMKRAHFDELHFSSVSDAITYLHIGISYHCDLFIDFSFLRYLVENYAVREIIFVVAHMASFFPSELQFFSYCLSLISKFQSLTITEHFLVYQMRRIHIMRQSSVSSEAAHDVSRLHKRAEDSIGSVRGFWKEIIHAKSQISFTSLRSLRLSTMAVDAAFLDTTEKFPNNQALCDEYSNYLLEAMGNFSAAALWRRRAMLVEQGKQLSVDHSFRSLMNVYPEYLLDHILDSHGVFIGKGLGTSSSSSSSISDSSISDTSEFDQKNEAVISSICDQGKLRLALQGTLQRMRNAPLSNANLIAALLMIFSIALYSLLFGFMPIIGDTVEERFNEEYYTTNALLEMQKIGYIASIQSSILGGYFSGQTTISNYTNSQLSSLNTPYLESHQTALEVDSSLQSLLESLLSDPSSNSAILNDLTNSSVNYLSNSSTSSYNSMKTCIVLLTDDCRTTATIGNANSTDSSLNQRLLTLTSNSLTISSYSSQLLIDLTSSGQSSISSMRNEATLIGVIPAVVLLVIFCYLQISNVFKVLQEIRRSSDVLRKVKCDLVDESLKPINKRNMNPTIKCDNVFPAHQINQIVVIFPIVIVAELLIIALILFFSIYSIYSEVASLGSIFAWMNLDGKRGLAILEAATAISAGVSGSITTANATSIIYSSLTDLQTANEELITNIIGFDTSLDTFQFSDTCSNISTNYTTYISCISLDRQISMASSFIVSLYQSFSSLSVANGLNKRDFAYLIYLIDGTLYSSLTSFHAKFYSSAVSQVEDIRSTAEPLWVAGICCAVVAYCIIIYILYLMQLSFDTVKQLLSFLPPSQVVKNSPLMHFILGKKTDENEVSMSLAEAIIFHSSNAAVVLNSDEIIQMVNPSLQTITGFTPDQILGQQINWLIPPPTKSSSSSDEDASSAQFYQRLSQMRNGIGERLSVVNVKCQTDIGSPVTVKATILAIFTDNPEKFDSFVLLLRNMTEEMEQKRAVQEAKKRTDQLLESLVPPQVLSVIKQQTGATLFVSQLATVIFIEIHGFVECVHSMAPKQLISTLNTVYNRFDEATSRYPAVHGLKTNDDLYVGCCGLFDFKDNPQAQAEQSVKFCLDLIQNIDEINDELGLQLQLRIGINMGGPLVGSVLNPTMPTFDILGSVISLAVRMQASGDIGVVQIGESVMKALPPNQYVIASGKEFANSRKAPDLSFVVKSYKPGAPSAAVPPV